MEKSTNNLLFFLGGREGVTLEPRSTSASLAGHQAGPGWDPTGFIPLGRGKKIKATGCRHSKLNSNNKAQHLIPCLLAEDGTATLMHARDAHGSVARPVLSRAALGDFPVVPSPFSAPPRVSLGGRLMSAGRFGLLASPLGLCLEALGCFSVVLLALWRVPASVVTSPCIVGKK